MAQQNSEDPLVNSEVYFLISKFLENGPCQKTFKALQHELEAHSLLPKSLDLDGKAHCQSLAVMSKKYPNINNDTLREMCERLRDVRRSQDPPGMLNVSSLLCAGRYSLLRADAGLSRIPYDRLVARRRGCPIPYPHGYKNPATNLVRVLDARACSGGLTRKRLVWPKLYNRIQLLNQTVGHISGVYCVLFDQTGQFIFTGADDLLVKVWSTVSGRLLATFRGASSEITDLAVNLENTMLAAGSLDRVCYVWCLQTTTLIAQLSANVGMITAVNFCPKTCHGMRYLASTSTDGSVAFWMYSHEPIGKDTCFNGQAIIFNEKMRPGVAQMICSSFSPGGVFLAAGSADHHVRVYLNTSVEGPQRIMEEEAHSDRVDSIQWANRGLRFVSGSKDGTALIWRYSCQKWNFIKLDNTLTLPGDTNQEVSEEQQRQKPRVSMVCWDKSDKWIVTAGQDAALKVWNSDTGVLLNVLRNHRRDIFVLEPHPLDEGILLSAGHDGLLCIWDIRDGSCLLQHQNLNEGRGNGLFYDAKWSPDGTLIAATDSYGHIMLFGFGAASACLRQIPKQLFFNTDYWPLVRDEAQGILDGTTGEPPHMMAAPFLCDVEGTPYPPHHQLLVPGREFQDSRSMEIPQIVDNDYPSRVVENGIGAAYFPSAELASSRGNTPNAWQTRRLLPLLQPSVIRQIVDVVEAKAKAEEQDYNRERRRTAVLPLKPAMVKAKTRKKRAPATYKTRAAATESSSQFVNPDTLDISHSSHSDSSENSSDDSNFSDSSSSSVYSDWIADHGVSLEPPTRSRRRRPPARLSPSPTNTRKRKPPKPTVDEQPQPSSDSDEEQDPLKPEKIKEVPAEYVPPKWLSEVMPRKAPYYPQMGDHCIFFQEGYKIYLDVVRSKQVYKPSTRDSFSRLNMDDPIHVQVIGIKYEIRPPRLCCLRLAVMDTDGIMTNQFFNIKYHDVPDVIDFLVLKQTYDIAMRRKWKPGDRFRCVIDDSWWLGIIDGIKSDKTYENSPFLSLETKWDNGESEFMSPWDMEPVDPTRLPPEPGGSIDLLPEEAQALLYTPGADEWPDGDRDGACERIITGLGVVMTLSVAEPFCAPVDLNLYPSYAMYVEYPLDLSTIKARLENRFYRRLTGVQFDVRYLATNAEKFNDVHSQIVKHARIVTELCLRIIKVVKEKSEFDVMEMYRQLTDDYKSSSEGEEEVEVEAEEIDTGVQLRSSKSSSLEHVNWRGDCERLLRELTSLPDSVPFRQPVDLTELPDYLRVISTPMDLGTVREELMAGNYNSPKDFYEAVSLIFSNSRKYNTNKKSRIHGMAVRLSNLFETRMNKLEHEWKTSRRRRIQQATQKRKLRVNPRPGPSRRSPSYEEIAVDPLRSSDDEDLLPLKDDDEPQPSTSREPIRMVLPRRWPPVGGASRDASDSDEDTNLSTLRFSLKQSGGDDENSQSNGGTDSRDVLLQNGTETSTDQDDYRELSTLRRSTEPNDIGGNGHSYAKMDESASSSTKVEVVRIPVSQEDSDDESNDEATLSSIAKTKKPTNGVVGGGLTSPEPDNDASSSWNGEEEEEEEENGEVEQDSDSSDSSSSSYKKPGRRKSRRTAVRKAVDRSRRGKKHATDSDESYDDEEEDLLPSNESSESSESEFSEPVATRGSRRSGNSRRSNRRKRKKSTSSDDSINPPRTRNKRRRKMTDSDDDSSPHPKSKRRRKNSTASESSTWQPSDQEHPSRKRRSNRRVARKARVESDEEDNGSSSEDEVRVSSRGRVRKLTEKAKAVLERRRR